MVGRMACRAGNPKCGLKTGTSVLLGPVCLQACDICCTEGNFCPECRCLLCCKEIDYDEHERDERFQCLQSIGGGLAFCGHSVHLECAVGNRMAGVRLPDMDVEYLCRRCDKKTDLFALVTRLVTSACVGSLAIADYEVRLCDRLVNGSHREDVKYLADIVQRTIQKADETGEDIQAILRDIIKNGSFMGPQPEEEKQQVMAEQEMVLASYHDCGGGEKQLPYEVLVSEYQTQVKDALELLQNSQEREYESAKEHLIKKMDDVLACYRIIREGVDQMRSAPSEAFVHETATHVEKLKRDREEFDRMLHIRDGFGSAPRDLLRDAFKWPAP